MNAIPSREMMLEDALDSLLNGLDANHDGRDGLTEEQWEKRCAEARAVLNANPGKGAWKAVLRDAFVAGACWADDNHSKRRMAYGEMMAEALRRWPKLEGAAPNTGGTP